MKKLTAQIGICDTAFVDCFAGGGGASTGIELATGHPIDIAINHDESAIMMHSMNHPFTEHYQEDIWMIDPETVTRGRHVRLGWFSPDCKHFSRAKGAALVDKHIRGLAWVVLRWAAKVRPDVIMLENVPEFVTWGPVRKGKPVKSKSGQTFERWRKQLEDLGYRVEWKLLCAADYGAPTIRKRLCLVARCDGRAIVFPKPTHAPQNSPGVLSGTLKPWRSAAEIIDWTIPSYSIFESKQAIKDKYGVSVVRPLRPNTLRRIIRGLDKFVLKSSSPFIVYSDKTIASSLIQYHTEQSESVRGSDLHEPMKTIDASNRYGLTSAYLVEYFSTGRPISVQEPMHTITTLDREALANVHITEFKGTDTGQSCDSPLRTITAGDGEFGIVRTMIDRYDNGKNLGHWPEVRELLNSFCDYHISDSEVLLLVVGNVKYYIYDICLRMLTPRELYNAMGFPQDYIIDRDNRGRPISRADQVARCGNAVCPAVAEAMVRANLPEECISKVDSMNELYRRITS